MEISKNLNQLFFLYLTQTDELDEVFYLMTEALKVYDILLLPVKIDQLGVMTNLAQSGPLIILSSIRSKKDFVIFEKETKKNIKYVLRNSRFYYFQISSFESTKFFRAPGQNRNAFFFKFPINLGELAAKLDKFYTIKKSNSQKWPGGAKSKLPTSVYNN